jgi:hypothetical protein
VQELHDALEALLVLHLGKRVLDRVDRVEIREVHLGEVVALLGVVDDVALLRGAVVDDLAFLGRELGERHVGANTHLADDILHEVPHEAAPHHHGALVDGLGLVGDERGLVHRAHHARALAGGAGAIAVEGKLLGAGTVEVLAAHGADRLALERHVHARRHVVAVGAHMASHAAVEQAQVVQELGHGTEGGAYVGDAGSLAQRQRGGHVEHLVHIGARVLGEAAARIGGERLQVAAAALGVEHAQRKARLARARHARDAHELMERDIDIDVLEVVDACATHLDGGRFVLRCHGWAFR